MPTSSCTGIGYWVSPKPKHSSAVCQTYDRDKARADRKAQRQARKASRR